MNKPLNEVIKALQVCQHDYPEKCPYFDSWHLECCTDNDNSESPVLRDALYHLKEYQKLLNKSIPNIKVPEEQLLLPGMELVDMKTGRVLSEREAYDYISENPDALEMFGPVRDYYSKHPEEFA